MNELTEQELERIISGIWEQMEAGAKVDETVVPADEALADRLALARRIGRLYLSFSRVIIEQLGKKKGAEVILEAIRDYSKHCADARKKGMVDLPARGIHKKTEMVTKDGKKKLRCYGCGISEEFSIQNEEKLGALYCYIDACSFMMTIPPIKLIHTQMEPLGDPCCEFDLAVAGEEELADVLEENRDFRGVDPIIKNGTRDLFE